MEMKYFIEEINSMRIHESNNDLSEWGRNKLNEYEFILIELAELKKLRVNDVSVSVCDFVWHNSDIVTNLKCRECGSGISKY